MTGFLVTKLQDQSFVVREAAGEAVGRFSENVGDDFLNRHKEVMPSLLQVCKDLAESKHELAKQKVLYALNEFAQNLTYDLPIYLVDIIQILLVYIKGNFERDVKYWAMFCMSNTILVADKKIQPHMSELVQIFSTIMNSTEAGVEAQTVKGEALMCAGRLAAACGKENFPMEAVDGFTKFGLQCIS